LVGTRGDQKQVLIKGEGRVMRVEWGGCRIVVAIVRGAAKIEARLW
jgi:hypothetical protein